MFALDGMLALAECKRRLSCDCQGTVFVPVGYASEDDGPATRRRLDGQFSVYQTEPFAHADQA